MKYIVVFISLLSFGFQAQSQEGSYEGQIDVFGNILKIDLTLKKKGDSFSGYIDIPQQNAKGISISDFEFVDDSIRFKLPDIPGGASITAKENGDSLNGVFLQGGKPFPYTSIRKADEPELALDLDKLKSQLDSIRIKLKVPGMSVGVIYKDKIIINEGFGLRDIESKEKVDENTIFAIGSTSKAFTAALVAKSVEDDLIEWNDPVRFVIPGFGMKDPQAIDINSVDLLTHRSGLPRHDLLWYGTEFTREELIYKIKDLEGTAPFRTKFQYQNLMYLTAGYMTAKLYNTTWDNLVSEKIFTPLGMNRTSSDLESLIKADNVSKPYVLVEKKNIEMPYRNIDAIGPAGSINSSSSDMLKWISMLLNGGKYGDDMDKSILKNRSINKLMTPYTIMSTRIMDDRFTEIMYGMGWMINYYHGHKMVSHGGNIDGFTAMVHLMPKDDLGIVILSNANSTNANQIAALAITDAILDTDDENWIDVFYPKGFDTSSKDKTKDESKSKKKKKIEKDGPYSDLESYSGKYEHKTYGSIEITVVNEDTLSMMLNGFTYKIHHYDKEVFSAKDVTYNSEMKIQFRYDINGEISYLEIELESSLDPFKFKKLALDKFKSPEYLKRFVGSYDLDEIQLKVLYENDELKLKVDGQGTFTLVPSSKNKFTVTELPGYSAEFIEDKKGNIEGVITHQPNGDFEGKKID